jgi:DNA-binding response OmpR family regulator
LAKVLIIDDELGMIKVLKEMLTRADFEVSTTTSGSEGIEAVRQQEPDVVVLDLIMPGVSGWEVCRTIRTFSQVPILILSAATGTDKVLQALDEGANDYLVKPTPKNVLISRVRMLAKQRSSLVSNSK